MSRGRRRRGWAVYLGPLVCAVAAALALFWAFGVGAAGDAADTSDADAAADEELTEAVAGLVDELTGSQASNSSSESFLEDIAALASEALDATGEESVVVAWEEAASLVELAAGVLEAYEEVEGAVLATSGYLDLQGNAWGAVVQGGTSWVDIVLVTTEDDETSQARIVRLLPIDVDGGA